MKLARVDRFTGTIIAIALVAGCVGVFLFPDLYRSQQDSRRSYADAVRGLDLIGELQYHAQEARRTLLYALSTTDSNLQVDYAGQSRAAEAHVAQTLAEYEQLALGRKETATAARLAKDWAAYLAVRDRLIAAMPEGDPKAAIARDLRDGVPAFNALRADLGKTRELLKKGAGQLLHEVDASFQRSLVCMAVILGMLAVLGVVNIWTARDHTMLGELRVTETRLREDFVQAQREERATAEALRRAEWKFRNLVEQLPAITYHAALGETCTWSYVSPQVFTVLGFTPEEWLASDRLWFDHVHPEDRAIPIEAEEVALRTGSFLAEYRMFTRNGEVRWLRDQALFVPGADPAEHALYGVMMDITDAKDAERRAQLSKKMVDSSRQAGMAEVATGVLHNVGNVLNSVNISAGLVLEKLRGSRVGGLAKAADLFAAHETDLAAFLTADEQGRRLPRYLQRLAGILGEENGAMRGEVEQLSKNIEHIKEIVAMQQNYARVTGCLDDLPADAMVEDALALNTASFARHGIDIARDFQPAPPVRVDKHKVLQILINLLRNAKHAVEDAGLRDPRIGIAVEHAGDRVRIAVTDNGVGIASENLTNVFRHGFTTKKQGHGFGLHSGANAAREMGGALTATSPGPGLGATFTLELPVARTTPNS